MEIRKIIKRLKAKYRTDNIFELAQAMGIIVLYEELGSINGYYNQKFRTKMIHINYNLDHHMQAFTCAHELAHSILHPNVNTPFLRSNTGLSINKYEIEANTFAVEFLISDDALVEYIEYGYTTEQIARVTGYHKKLIELRTK